VAAKPENTFIASVHRHLPPVDELYRMKNNNEYVSGIADCWYSADRDLWVEYKFVVLPKRPDTMIPITVSPLQQDWLKCRQAEGRNIWVIVGCKEGGVVFKDMTVLRPVMAAVFRELIRSRNEIAKSLVSFLTPAHEPSTALYDGSRPASRLPHCLNSAAASVSRKTAG
jgi:hypothetical protein